MSSGQADTGTVSPPTPESSGAPPASRPGPASSPRGSRRRRLIIEYAIIAALAVGLALLVQAFIIKPYRIPSESMKDTLLIGDRIFVNRFIYHFRDVERSDIVVFHAPGSGVVLVKRVVGLPGETLSLKGGAVYVDGRRLDESYVRRLAGQASPTEPFPTGTAWSLERPYTVPADSYFMMGDNRGNSGDSREFGPVERDDIIGTAFFVYWPLKRISVL